MASSFASRARGLWAEARDGAREFGRSARVLAVFGATWWAVDRYVLTLTVLHGPSMLPTLAASGDIVVVDKLSPRLRAWPIRVNDVVVAESSYKRNYSVCKRVVAMPGDAVHPRGWPAAVVVPPGHVWLEGDNAQDSVDSRNYGPVPLALLRGRVYARVWPLSTAMVLRHDAPRPRRNDVVLADFLSDPAIVADAQARWGGGGGGSQQQQRPLLVAPPLETVLRELPPPLLVAAPREQPGAEAASALNGHCVDSLRQGMNVNVGGALGLAEVVVAVPSQSVDVGNELEPPRGGGGGRPSFADSDAPLLQPEVVAAADATVPIPTDDAMLREGPAADAYAAGASP